jgi:hypothetical protein
MPTLHLYHFRYCDPIRHKWLLARYVAEREVIAERYPQFELIEPPEVRELADDWLYADASRVAYRPRYSRLRTRFHARFVSQTRHTDQGETQR